jgi:hypothetical protein
VHNDAEEANPERLPLKGRNCPSTDARAQIAPLENQLRTEEDPYGVKFTRLSPDKRHNLFCKVKSEIKVKSKSERGTMGTVRARVRLERKWFS